MLRLPLPTDVAMELAASFAPKFHPKKKARMKATKTNGEKRRTSGAIRNLPFLED
jgi:hypothetical protein